MTKLDRFLELFHDGRESEYERILQVFNTTRNFLKIVVKYNQQEDVDIGYQRAMEDYVTKSERAGETYQYQTGDIGRRLESYSCCMFLRLNRYLLVKVRLVSRETLLCF